VSARPIGEPFAGITLDRHCGLLGEHGSLNAS
jgi:hypothetical protein